ncbi:MAG: HAD hydrolase-like protein [Ruminococcus sp.]|nr:HAD hydrolase-like protein [Ruminococcus sp.]
MIKPYRTVLFDLDGTLTDSREGVINCLRHASDVMGFDMPEDTDRFLGPPLQWSFRNLCGMDEEQSAEAVRVFRERYSTIGLFENRVYDGIPELLGRLRDNGISLHVATCKVDTYAERIMERFGLMQYFDIIGGAGIDGTRIEKHEVIDYVLSRAGITDRSSVLMLGDRLNDIAGAHRAGIDCLGALWGYGSREELESGGAELIADTPQQAADIITGR